MPCYKVYFYDTVVPMVQPNFFVSNGYPTLEQSVVKRIHILLAMPTKTFYSTAI